jgi:hypothetical protein
MLEARHILDVVCCPSGNSVAEVMQDDNVLSVTGRSGTQADDLWRLVG